MCTGTGVMADVEVVHPPNIIPLPTEGPTTTSPNQNGKNSFMPLTLRIESIISHTISYTIHSQVAKVVGQGRSQLA